MINLLYIYNRLSTGADCIARVRARSKNSSSNHRKHCTKTKNRDEMSKIIVTVTILISPAFVWFVNFLNNFV